jgi:hypothetical protein
MHVKFTVCVILNVMEFPPFFTHFFLNFKYSPLQPVFKQLKTNKAVLDVRTLIQCDISRPVRNWI